MKSGQFRKWDRFNLTYSIWNYNCDLERDRQDRQRSEELRTYGRTDRDANGTLRFQTCNSTRYQTVCQ